VQAVQHFLKSYAEGGGANADEELQKLKRKLSNGPDSQTQVTANYVDTAISMLLEQGTPVQASTSWQLQSQQRQQQSAPQQHAPSSFLPPEASWSNMLLDTPSPGTQLIHMLNFGGGNSGITGSSPMTNLMMGSGVAGSTFSTPPNSYFGFNTADKQ